MKNIIILLLLVTSSVSAAIYKWTDSDGKVHFGDKPVDQSSATELNIKINNHTGVSHSSGRNKDREYLLKKIDERKQEDAEKSKEQRELNKKNKQRCLNAKSKLQLQIQANSMYKMGPDGERTYLSDKQRAKRKKQIQKAIAKYCR